MRKIFGFLALLAAGLCIAADFLYAESPEESLKRIFPVFKYESFRPSNVKGVYEVVSGDRVVYYAPEAEVLFFGDLITTKGRNLTQERIAEVMEQKIKEIPLEKAIKIGSGKNVVIEFSDPGCTFSRKAYQFFSGRTDVTKYVFFLSPQSRQDSERKAKYVLSSTDKAGAYHDAMSGKLDDMKFKVADEAKGDQLLKSHRELGGRLGISGTPYFFVNGKVVRGANLPLISKILEEAKK
jgi:thiol:disulfide interchange protein DsbC